MVIKYKLKKVYDKEHYVFYLADMDPEFKEMIRQRYIALSSSEEFEFEGKQHPCCALVKTTMVDNGDYDYYDNYQPYYEEVESFKEISFNPVNGEKIEFEEVDVFDYTQIADDIKAEIHLTEKGRSIKAREKVIYLWGQYMDFFISNIDYGDEDE